MKPVCVSTWHDDRKYFRQFMETAKKHGIEPQNADDSRWPGQDWDTIEWWRKSAAQAKFVRDHEDDYTHFMFTDSYDILFATGWDEIMNKFMKFGVPLVFGAECHPWPYPEKANLFPKTERRCRYLNAGFWMGSTGAVMKFIEELEQRAFRKEQCDQGIMVDIFLSGKYDSRLDSECSILHCCNLDSIDFLEFQNGRLTNKETGQTPCMFHGNGNAPLHKIIQWL